MNPIKQFYMNTSELVQYLEEKQEPDRDQRIEKIQHLLNERDEALKKVKAPLSAGEKMLVQEAQKLNEKLVKLLEEEKMSIKEDWDLLKKQQQTRQKYINPYQSLATDGVYFDKKK